MSGYYDESQSYSEEQSSYDQYGGRGPRRGGYEDQSYEQSETFTEQSSYGGGGGYGGGGPPPPPRVPWPWRARWDERSRQYCFEHEQTGEVVWSFEEVQVRTRESGGRGGREYYDQSSETIEESSGYARGGGGYGGGYGGGGYAGGSEQVYESETMTEEESRRRGGGGGGHGLAYGAMGAVGGLAAGAFAMYEGEKIRKFSFWPLPSSRFVS